MTISFRFRPFELFLLLLPVLGFCMKYLHLPLANILLMLSMPLPLFYYLLRSITQIHKNPNLAKEDKAFLPSAFLGGSITIWLLYLTWKFLYLPIVTPFFYLGCLISVGMVYMVIRHKAVEWVPLLAFVFFGTCAVTLYSLPTHKVYRFMNLHDTDLADKEKGAFVWDTYSWHLYQDGEFDQALEANTKAKEAAVWENELKTNSTTAQPIIQELEMHREQIQARSWYQFKSLWEIQDSAWAAGSRH